mmetsp:Transcript_10784/g.25541  ORF Transcript_10784/g.25541 Transcript_10784/m.25541 type:complete len:221 (-) Transcript_10784:25-687(-)
MIHAMNSTANVVAIWSAAKETKRAKAHLDNPRGINPKVAELRLKSKYDTSRMEYGHAEKDEAVCENDCDGQANTKHENALFIGSISRRRNENECHYNISTVFSMDLTTEIQSTQPKLPSECTISKQKKIMKHSFSLPFVSVNQSRKSLHVALTSRMVRFSVPGRNRHRNTHGIFKREEHSCPSETLEIKRPPSFRIIEIGHCFTMRASYQSKVTAFVAYK